MIKNMAAKQNVDGLLDRCASKALGRSIQVVLTTKDELPDVVDACKERPVMAKPAETAPAAEDDFEASLRKLQELSQMQGFEFTQTES